MDVRDFEDSTTFNERLSEMIKNTENDDFFSKTDCKSANAINTFRKETIEYLKANKLKTVNYHDFIMELKEIKKEMDAGESEGQQKITEEKAGIDDLDELSESKTRSTEECGC